MLIETLPIDLYGDAVALWRSAGLTRPWNDPDADLERALDGPSSTVLAATEGGRLIGTAMVGHDGHRGWVYYLAVDPRSQRHGVGRELMRAGETWLAERVPKLQLMVRTLASSAPAGIEPIPSGMRSNWCSTMPKTIDHPTDTPGPNTRTRKSHKGGVDTDSQGDHAGPITRRGVGSGNVPLGSAHVRPPGPGDVRTSAEPGIARRRTRDTRLWGRSPDAHPPPWLR